MGCLHDTQKISDKPVLFPWRFVSILPCLDGRHNLLDLQTEYMRVCGDILFREDLIDFLQKLDYYLFLDSERYSKFVGEIKQKFLESPVRPPFFSGFSYSSDPRVLREELEGFFNANNGPGALSTDDIEDVPAPVTGQVSGIIAPHIELKSGGPCYAWGYSELLRFKILPELFIILGTCHSEIINLFSLTAKTFITPLGNVKCDEEFSILLQTNSKTDLFSDEFLHRAEHTIEFQLLFLQFISEKLGIDVPSICPILCSFPPDCLSENAPEKDIYDSFVGSLKHIIKTYDKSVCIICSADLAHIGPKFGDRQALDHLGKQACFNEDRLMLDMVAKQDNRGFQDNMVKTYERRKICGYPPIRTMLDILPPSEGRLLDYEYCAVDDLGSIVTYASMVFHRL